MPCSLSYFSSLQSHMNLEEKISGGGSHSDVENSFRESVVKL